MSRPNRDGGSGDDPIDRSTAAIAELLALRELWFERSAAGQSAREVSRAREGIARCESLIVRIETVHLGRRGGWPPALGGRTP